MTNPKPGERIETVIDDRGVTLTDTATGLTVTLQPSTARDTVQTVIQACDQLGRKLAAHKLAQCTCGPAFLDLPTAWHTKDCPAYYAPERPVTDNNREIHIHNAPQALRDSTWVFTWSRIEKSSDVAVGPAGAILRHDIQRFRIRYFRIGMTDRWEVIAYTEGDNHIVSKTHSTLESAQEDLKTLIGTTND